MKKLRRIFFVCVLALVTLFMVACTPDTVEEAKKKMEKEGYRVVVTKEKDEDYGMLAMLQITSKSDPSDITFAYYFDSIASAKRYFGNDDDLNRLNKEFGDDDSLWRRHDRWVLLGSRRAIWDFRS